MSNNLHDIDSIHLNTVHIFENWRVYAKN